jgi:hypothetical protein
MKLIQYQSYDGSELALFEFDDETSMSKISECFKDAEFHVKTMEDADTLEDESPLNVLEEYMKTQYGAVRTFTDAIFCSEYL